mmetsp:Transcript_130160/g.296813  ORF Transcript_130160/g.296813 Transcript_130160/m.296813 type:complete len:235 (-) Transcript_130160:66-770(-)
MTARKKQYRAWQVWNSDGAPQHQRGPVELEDHHLDLPTPNAWPALNGAQQLAPRTRDLVPCSFATNCGAAHEIQIARSASVTERARAASEAHASDSAIRKAPCPALGAAGRTAAVNSRCVSPQPRHVAQRPGTGSATLCSLPSGQHWMWESGQIVRQQQAPHRLRWQPSNQHRSASPRRAKKPHGPSPSLTTPWLRAGWVTAHCWAHQLSSRKPEKRTSWTKTPQACCHLKVPA